jgi:hypothetical protein
MRKCSLCFVVCAFLLLIEHRSHNADRIIHNLLVCAASIMAVAAVCLAEHCEYHILLITLRCKRYAHTSYACCVLNTVNSAVS